MTKKQSLNAYANLLFEVGALAHTPRSGFRHLNWHQSVAEHSFRTAYIGFVLAHMEIESGIEVNINRVVECGLFHDLGEARTGDLDYIAQKYSKADEVKAVEDAVAGMSFGSKIVEAVKETDERSTIEGNIAKDADALELLCSLIEIINSGNQKAKDWIPPLLKRLRTSSAQQLASVILKTNSDEWWFANKKDKYWVSGGKIKQ